ncbi:hypothetical protein [Solidesulfovibrio carbinolicus]|uniref:Uncharacterized protein n=1 Tax=Solidesulfovibrio carbinolicus TaxID=296842 RepID=A0A4P6I616_9BACT|nr:hypothetical protein [Solidesulfovibrio carbinolicus]QAZ69569.1 hypothetical protein C3Y92_19950 [Solidesulfovibrio carbinolicus]
MATSMTQLLRKAAQSRMAGQPPAAAAAPEGRREVFADAVPHIEQTNTADKALIKTNQTNQTDELDSLPQQLKPTVELVRVVQPLAQTAEQTKQADKISGQTDTPSTQIKQYKPTNKSSIESQQPKKALKVGSQKEQSKQTEKPSGLAAPAMRLPPRLPIATMAQKTLAAHFLETGPVVTTYAVIAAETGVPLGTARTIIDKFVAAGWLRKEQWGAGRNRALSLAPTEALAAVTRDSQADKIYIQSQQTKQPYKPKGRAQQSSLAVEFNSENAPLKIERKNLSISPETVRTSWPCLARAGFGLAQLEQIHDALAQLGKSADRIIQGLDHAEWELAEGKMLDKAGQPVADPCAWVFRSLASQGYYRRPAGYVSAEEQAELDAANEAKALAQSREQARLARFRAWEQGLSREAREKALEGRRGPEEIWLKNFWVKLGEPS